MISVIIPAYNEAEGLETLYERLTRCAAEWDEEYELILVDDGSNDDTLVRAQRIAIEDPQFKVISLSRNFGHQSAVTAGLEYAGGDLVAIIDADLQDPPEELPRFFAKCREGFDVVYGIRTKRKENALKLAAYWTFYRLLSSFSHIDIPADSGDFCVLSQRAVDALNALPERNRFIRALRSWIGFRQTGIVYERHARAAGKPKYTIRKLVNLALDGLINFSTRPLKMIAVMGMILALVSLFAAIFVLTQYAGNWTIWGYNPRDSRGWTSLMLAILFLAGIQLFSLGVIGEYIGRLFEEVKRRPAYLVDRTINLQTDARHVSHFQDEFGQTGEALPSSQSEALEHVAEEWRPPQRPKKRPSVAAPVFFDET